MPWLASLKLWGSSCLTSCLFTKIFRVSSPHPSYVTSTFIPLDGLIQMIRGITESSLHGLFLVSLVTSWILFSSMFWRLSSISVIFLLMEFIWVTRVSLLWWWIFLATSVSNLVTFFNRSWSRVVVCWMTTFSRLATLLLIEAISLPCTTIFLAICLFTRSA